MGLAKTAMEAGNSEEEALKSYNDAKSEEQAKQWFAVLEIVLRTMQRCGFADPSDRSRCSQRVQMNPWSLRFTATAALTPAAPLR